MTMRKIDSIGLLLCDLQGETFERSIELTETSSEIFMRRFMYSKTVKMLDNETIISSNMQAKDIVEMVTEEYKASKYGSVKYSREEMYWIGYLYRYFSYTYNKSSKQVYKIVKPKELRKLYPAYHTLGVDQAIERILEAKGINPQENELERQYAIFKRIREESPRYK